MVPKTIAPWKYGNQPADPITRKIEPKPATSLWNVPEDEQKSKNMPFEPSGDPILDSLKCQLYRHGANGILSLSKKFRIMDDDDNGNLDMNEFRKAMRECELVNLSDLAVQHLFRYFGTCLSIAGCRDGWRDADTDDSGGISLDEFLVGIRVCVLSWMTSSYGGSNS